MTSNSIPQAVFGPGSLYVARTDTAIASNTPLNIGYCNEFSYDETPEVKELYGQNNRALVVANGTIKSTGKIKAATISGLALNAVMYGQSFTAGQTLLAQNESHTIAAGGLLTIAPPATGTFDIDLGVINATTNLPFSRGTTAPTAGQYEVSSLGVYTFFTGDATVGALVTYAYKTTTLGGQTQAVNTQPIGTTPTFQLDYYSTLYGSGYYIRFYACIAAKLARAHKLTDFMMPEIDIAFFANASGNVYETSYANIA